MLTCALVVPLAGAATALWLRRTTAAALFTAAVVCSTLGILALASPTEIADGLAGAFRSPPPDASPATIGHHGEP